MFVNIKKLSFGHIVERYKIKNHPTAQLDGLDHIKLL